MTYGAITIDTSIFDGNGLKLESGLLKKLSQFKESPANLILSEIILRELKSHLTKKIREVMIQAEKTFKECQNHLGLDPEAIVKAKEAVLPADNDELIAAARITRFIKSTGLIVIPANDKIDVPVLLDKYFSGKPPFSDSGKKKSEFPDAIALMTLEIWAKENETKVIAVSTDSDWAAYGRESEDIEVVSDLAEAIAIFQPRNTAYAFCIRLADDLPQGRANKILDAIQGFLADKIPDMDLSPDASSDYYFDADYVEVTFDDFELLTEENGKAMLQPVEVEAEKVVVEAKILVRADASCYFDLSVYDSTDKEYIPMSSTTATENLEFETELLFTLSGDFRKGLEDLEISDFEILSLPSDVDFGYIEPDWGHDEE